MILIGWMNMGELLMDSPQTCQGAGGRGQARFLIRYTLPEHLKQTGNSWRRKRYSFIILFCFVAEHHTLSNIFNNK